MENKRERVEGNTKDPQEKLPFNDRKESIYSEILTGLKLEQKELPPKYFYDEKGSALFDQICGLEEYYPTRTETEILTENIDEIVDSIHSNSVIIEYGSGSSIKTKILLDNLPDLGTYIPVDISYSHLHKSAKALQSRYPNLKIIPVTADYTKNFDLPSIASKTKKNTVFFPGSTIGNFYPKQAIAFLKKVANQVGSGGGLIIGIDLKKDPQILNLAYNDSQGITEKFNLNMLSNINSILGSNFNLDNFRHFAEYNLQFGRIEMHLVSKVDQMVSIGEEEITFENGENLLTEVSYKYSLEEIQEIADQSGFTLRKSWVDEKKYFSVNCLTID